jgi:hypothetical protein
MARIGGFDPYRGEREAAERERALERISEIRRTKNMIIGVSKKTAILRAVRGHSEKRGTKGISLSPLKFLENEESEPVASNHKNSRGP